MVDVPDWVYDRVFPGKSRAAILVTMALYRYGSARVIGSERRVYLQESRERLARLALCSKRALDAGVSDLVGADFLTVHPSDHSRKPDGFSLPVAPSWGATSAPNGPQLLHPSAKLGHATSAPLGSSVSDLDLPDQPITDLDPPNDVAGAGARDPWTVDQMRTLGFQEYEIPELCDRFGDAVLADAIDRLWRHLPDPGIGELDCWANRIGAGKLRNPRGFVVKLAKELAAETPLTSRMEHR